MKDQTDCKTVQEWPLIGDPSLKIGGYPAAAGLKAKIYDATSGIEADLGETVHLTGVAYSGQAPYTYAWDLDEDGIYDDDTGSTASRSWIIPGVYWVSLKVTDNNGKVATYDTIVGVGDWLGLGNYLLPGENQQSSPQSNPSTNPQNQQSIPGSQQNNLPILLQMAIRAKTVNTNT
jgi:hypothetical protein